MWINKVSFFALAWFLVALAILSVLFGCSFYNKPFPVATAENGYDLKFVQVDDFGSFWDPKEANDTFEDLV